MFFFPEQLLFDVLYVGLQTIWNWFFVRGLRWRSRSSFACLFVFFSIWICSFSNTIFGRDHTLSTEIHFWNKFKVEIPNRERTLFCCLRFQTAVHGKRHRMCVKCASLSCTSRGSDSLQMILMPGVWPTLEGLLFHPDHPELIRLCISLFCMPLLSMYRPWYLLWISVVEKTS